MNRTRRGTGNRVVLAPLVGAALLLLFEASRAPACAAQWVFLSVAGLLFFGAVSLALTNARVTVARRLFDGGIALIVLSGGGFFLSGSVAAMSATQAFLAFWAPVLVAWWSVIYRDQVGRVVIYLILLYGSLMFAYADTVDRVFPEFVALGVVEAVAVHFGLAHRELMAAWGEATGSGGSAMVDPVSGFSTPAAFELELAMITAMANRASLPFCLLGCEIDGFDRYVERFGAALGRDLLQATAWAISDCIRESDTAGRWDDNRFLVILAATRLDEATPVLEKLRAAVQSVVAIDRGPVDLRFSVAEHAFGDGPMVLVERVERQLATVSHTGPAGAVVV